MATFTHSRVVATPGGPGTFAGQATEAFLARMPQLGPAQYLPALDEIWAAVSAGTADSAELTSETSARSAAPPARR